MEELTINVQETAGSIAFELDTLKASLREMTGVYKGLVVTEDTLQGAKKDLAMLRKLSKELNDRKIAVKKSFMAPYDAFEKEVKEALAIIDEPVKLIDSQVKEFEARRKEEQKAHCIEVFNEAVGEYAEYITFESVFKDSWLNATAKDKDIVDDVQTRVVQVKNDIQTLKALNSDIEADLLEAYKTYGLAMAVQRNTDYMKAKQKITEDAIKEQTELEASEPIKEPVEEPAEVPQAIPTEENSSKDNTYVDVSIPVSSWEDVKRFLDFSEIKYKVNSNSIVFAKFE